MRCRDKGAVSRPRLVAVVAATAAATTAAAPLPSPLLCAGAVVVAAAAAAPRHRRRCRCSSSTTAQQQATAAAPSSAGQQQQHCQDLPELLGDVRVVLVAPKTPSNIGAVARACGNFEALDLVVVAPRCDPRDGEVFKIACGEAALSRMRVVDSLQEALADTTGSVGFTRRAGCTRLTHASIAAMLRDFPDAVPGMRRPSAGSSGDGGGEGSSGSGEGSGSSSSSSSDGVWAEVAAHGATALVFGREESGLNEDELRLCSHACAIPSGRVQPSLNLSHAVCTVLATLFERRLAALGLEEAPVGQDVAGNPRVQAGLQPAAASELEALLGKVAAVARAVGVRWERKRGGGGTGHACIAGVLREESGTMHTNRSQKPKPSPRPPLSVR